MRFPLYAKILALLFANLLAIAAVVTADNPFGMT